MTAKLAGIAPISMTTAAGDSALPKIPVVWVQALLYGNPTANLHIRVEYADGLTAQTVALSQCMLEHKGAVPLQIAHKTGDTPRVYWLFTDSTGTALVDGAIVAGNKLLLLPG